jgi:hypothetical protein
MIFRSLVQTIRANLRESLTSAMFIAVVSLCVPVYSAKKSRDQLALAHPARLKVHNISMLPKEKAWQGPLLQAGRVLEGIVQVTNFGREYAGIKDATCMGLLASRTSSHESPLFRPERWRLL